MRTTLLAISAAIGVAMISPAAHAQVEMTWHSVDGGSFVNASGGGFTLTGTFGQPDVGRGNAGAVSLRGGFWGPITRPPCVPNFNDDASLDVNDFFAFLSAYSSNNPRADIDDSGFVDVNDFFYFLEQFSQGCAGL